MKDEKYIVLVLLILLGGLMLIVGIINIGKFPMLFVIGLFLIFFFPVILLKYPKYTAPILFMTAGVFIISFGIFLGWRSVIFEHDSQGNRFLVVIPCLLGGLIVVIGTPIRYNRRNERQKKLDSMVLSDVSKMFDCPKSGVKGAVKFIKLEKDQILVRHGCPIQGVRLLRIPIRFKDQCISHFRDTAFQCFKCGNESRIDHVKYSGPFTLVKLSCPTHGTNIPYHKISSSIYDEISNEGINATQSVHSKLIPSEKIKFCPNCGEEFKEPDQRFCLNCGSER